MCVDAVSPVSGPGLVGNFPDDHDGRRTVAWYPELSGIPPLLEAATRRLSVVAAQHQHACS